MLARKEVQVMLNDTIRQTLAEVAGERGMVPAALMAVVEVESGGKVFARVQNRLEPVIRFEGHYFYRLLSTSDRNRAIIQGLADRRAGRITNPPTQSGRWDILERAKRIDRSAALQSVSWGVGQVMGIHWRWLGYGSVDHMVSIARSGLEGQVDLMLNFVEKAGLEEAIDQQDWRAFARGYNGPGYAKHGYHKKLAKAFTRYSRLLGGITNKNRSISNAPLLVKFGQKGDVVRELQLQLRAAGYGVAVDGDFGPVTRRAVRRFQQYHKLAPDGIVGSKTFEILARYLPTK